MNQQMLQSKLNEAWGLYQHRVKSDPEVRPAAHALKKLIEEEERASSGNPLSAMVALTRDANDRGHLTDGGAWLAMVALQMILNERANNTDHLRELFAAKLAGVA